MGEPVPIALGKGSRKARFGQKGVAEFVNAYVEDLGDGTKTGLSVSAIAGSELFATLTSGNGVRAMLGVDQLSSLMVVAGRLLFRVGIGGGTVSAVGGVPSDGHVTIAHNRATPNPHVVAVCDGAWFIYQGGTFTEGSDPDLPPPVAVVEHNGYFVFLISDGRWFIVGPDSVSVDALLAAEAESNADGLVMGAARGQDLLLFGSESLEVWNDTGAADFPYTRSLTLSVGCYAAGSVSNIIAQAGGRLVDTVIWAATDSKGSFAGVYMLDGFTPVKISTGEVDRLIKAETDPRVLRSMAWTDEGQEEVRSFYAISGTAFTMVFDTRTGEWHARKSAGLERWRYDCHAAIGGQHIFGHYSSNELHAQDVSLGTEDGDQIPWSVTIPTIHMFPFAFRVNALYADALTGVGLVSSNAQDSQPKLLIDYTKDGGNSWATVRFVSLGTAAQAYVRVKERLFGRCDKNGIAFRFRSFAAVARSIQQLAIDIDKLAA